MKEALLELRKKYGLSQYSMAQKLYVTRQAVSRWECGETVPNLETLKRISTQFEIGLNELLGIPLTGICQSCGMPLSQETFAQEDESSLNQNYCKWCYENGDFITDCTMDEMVEQCIPHMGWEDNDKCREFLKGVMVNLERWK
ncbi:zinc ribbon domain-containing protein [Anaerotignum sp. MB30-C6]|uniref:zinc ribbon domain-containing protein n=1 Tax=Anaerotignum sp. MB30-C6 TaxID=3070814 RepID=UPI0027DB1270|nr:zinc ribbon domain-containing protein [Anaerotignum sp. MB30-C6]WMI81724.1 zinc ribbon domain-containing protein [Anaerotignum sp. MB30-C6]